MDPAFKLLAAPAAGARVRRIVWNRCARLASDARVSAVVLWKIGQAVLSRVFPDLRPCPVCERTYLQQSFPARQTVLLDLLQIFAGGRLFAAQPREPNIEGFKRSHQGLYFAQLAALRGLLAIENSKLRLLLFNCFLWKYIHQVQRPVLSHAISILIGLGKVISGVEKQYGNIRHPLPEEVEHDHVLSLEAARDASARFRAASQKRVQNGFGAVIFQCSSLFESIHFSPPFHASLAITRYEATQRAKESAQLLFEDRSGVLGPLNRTENFRRRLQALSALQAEFSQRNR